MAIKLQIYLKRKGMSLAEWVKHHKVSSTNELGPLAIDKGLSISPDDVKQVASVLKELKKAAAPKVIHVVKVDDKDSLPSAEPVVEKQKVQSTKKKTKSKPASTASTSDDTKLD